ncbi:MAG: YdcF family protein [Desulfobacterales bacterium]|jgi:hypothetical protein|nr:YdcF family protein [Desulfobacterales bacterium]
MLYRAVMGLLFLLLGCVAAFLVWGREALSNWDHPLHEPFELVVVLAGPLDEDGRRVAAAVELARTSGNRFLLLPLRHRALSWPWFVRHYRIDPPLPEERVIIGRPEDSKRVETAELGGTFAEARKTIAVMREQGFRSAVIVTSGYHIRRARLAFQRAVTDPGLTFQFHAMDSAQKAPDRLWWLDGKSLMRVADEYWKLAAGYAFYK